MAGIPTASNVNAPPPEKRQRVKYRVLMGQHVQFDEKGIECCYYAGQGGHDIFETEADMLRMNGGGGMQPKFELVGDGSYIPPHGAVWDPSRESIDQFSARMKATVKEGEQAKLQAEQEHSAAVAQPLQPKVVKPSQPPVPTAPKVSTPAKK